MDDALHYLQEHGLIGNHCTDASPKVKTVNGLVCNGATNGGDPGFDVANTNGVNGHLTNGHSQSLPSKLLVWTAVDEKALGRVTQAYGTYCKDHVSDDADKLDELAFTLAARRSCMLWRTFAIVTGGNKNKDLNLVPAKPVRSSTETGLAFIFTGQGAQYVEMGIGLLGYLKYKETLQQINDIYRGLGCQWSIFGK